MGGSRRAGRLCHLLCRPAPGCRRDGRRRNGDGLAHPSARLGIGRGRFDLPARPRSLGHSSPREA